MKAPPYPQNRPDSALPPSPQPHQAPWGRVSEACGWANLRAANLHLARRACLTHDLAARLPIRSCSRRRRPAPAHRTELRANARARAAAHAKDTSSDGSRSCASVAATRQPGPFRLQSPAGRRQQHVERAFRTIWALGAGVEFSGKFSILAHRTILWCMSRPGPSGRYVRTSMLRS